MADRREGMHQRIVDRQLCDHLTVITSAESAVDAVGRGRYGWQASLIVKTVCGDEER